MAGYRQVGVSLVARAMGCVSVWLVEQDLRGRVEVTRWDGSGEVVARGWAVDGEVVAVLADLPVLRPGVDADGAIVLTVRSPAVGLVGWRLVGEDPFDQADVVAATRMVSLLADPEMRAPDGPGAACAARVLTARESEILSLVGEGLTARAVARRLGISVRTVHKHLEQAYRKLDCHDRLSAVLLARGSGLLVPAG